MPTAVVKDWAQRKATDNDAHLRNAFTNVLTESMAQPPDERLVMYDACDEHEVKAPLGPNFRRRLDGRRNTKPKKSDDQRLVCTPFNENGFHFGKIKNDRERLVKLELAGHRYDILTNKFPLFNKHMLLVADALVPQQLTAAHLGAITELLGATTGFCAYFNSWCASASVNHFHCHLIDEFPPVTTFELVDGPTVAGVPCLRPAGFPGDCYCVPASAVDLVAKLVLEMQADNQPHNLLLTPRMVYVFPKPIVRPSKSFTLYPETVGGPELIGSFTVYTQADYDALSLESIDQLCAMNTAPLPARLLAVCGAPSTAPAKEEEASERDEPARSVRQRTSDPGLHAQSWPQDRPIARALASNIALV